VTGKIIRPERVGDRTNLALGILFLGAFVVGTAELVVVGVLNLVACARHGGIDQRGGHPRHRLRVGGSPSVVLSSPL